MVTGTFSGKLGEEKKERVRSADSQRRRDSKSA
jgi:hypothetical protein